MLFTLLVIPWCLLCQASSCVDGLQREGGGWFSWCLLGRRVRWRGGVVHCVLLACPWLFHPRGVRGGGFGLVLPRHTLLVYASVCGHTRVRGLCVWWRWCALWWRVAPFSRFRGGGCSSYLHCFPHGPPIRCSLIPLMFRSSVLAASCSSCVLWRCPHFLRRWRLPPALMAYGEREEGEGVFHGAFSVGGCAAVAVLCVCFVLVVHPWSFYPRGVCGGRLGFVIPRHTLLVFVCARGHTTLALFAPSVCVFGGGGLLSGDVCLPSLGFVGVSFIPSLLSAWAAH